MEQGAQTGLRKNGTGGSSIATRLQPGTGWVGNMGCPTRSFLVWVVLSGSSARRGTQDATGQKSTASKSVVVGSSETTRNSSKTFCSHVDISTSKSFMTFLKEAAWPWLSLTRKQGATDIFCHFSLARIFVKTMTLLGIQNRNLDGGDQANGVRAQFFHEDDNSSWNLNAH